MINFTIPGQPQGKGRHRSFVRNGHVSHYTPEKTRSYEGVITTLAMEAMRGMKPSEKPLELRLLIKFAVPASWPQWKREAALRGEVAPTTKPDADNVIKAVKDAMNMIVWRDDCQVVDLNVSKSYSQTPCVEVMVHERGILPAQVKKRA